MMRKYARLGVVAFRFAGILGHCFFTACSPSPTANASASASRQIQEYYGDGLPRKEWEKWPDFEMTDFTFKGIQVTSVQISSVNSYGFTFDLFIFYRANQDEPATNEWRQCFRFSARSYDKLRLDFDDEKDRFRIFGVIPRDRHEELLLERFHFHDAFTCYIPKDF